MGATSRFGLRWPELTDAPNGPAQFQALAGDTENWLCRGFPCTSSTRPTGVPDGFVIRETDTGNWLGWNGSAWVALSVASTGGSGGGGTSLINTISATYAATAAQSIATGQNVIIAFGVEQTADPAVTRSTNGAGHKFTLGQTRLWVITATLQFATFSTGRRVFEMINAGSGATLAKSSGPTDTAQPWTTTLVVARKFTAGTTVSVQAFHTSTTSQSLEPGGGNLVHIDIAGI